MRSAVISYPLALLLCVLQYKLWLAPEGMPHVWLIKDRIALLQNQFREETHRNRLLTAEIEDLKQGYVAIEEHARTQLGLVKPGEIYYQFINGTH